MLTYASFSREIPKISDGCSAPNSGRFLQARIAPQAAGFAAVGNIDLPFARLFAPRHALVPRRVVPAQACVHHILSLVSNAQIADTVISSDTIDVIDGSCRPFTVMHRPNQPVNRIVLRGSLWIRDVRIKMAVPMWATGFAPRNSGVPRVIRRARRNARQPIESALRRGVPENLTKVLNRYHWAKLYPRRQIATAVLASPQVAA